MDWKHQGMVNRNVAAFCRPSEPLGEFSNFAVASQRLGKERLSLNVQGTVIPCVEHLYRALKFSRHPVIQHRILAQRSAMFAKRLARKRDWATCIRPDWEDVKLDVMRWCVRIKITQHFVPMYRTFKDTVDHDGQGRAIVELSAHDRYWGATPSPTDPRLLEGENHLGRIFMEMRDWVLSWLDGDDGPDQLQPVAPPPLPDLLLLGQPIGPVMA